MTQWQWKVIRALIRQVMRNSSGEKQVEFYKKGTRRLGTPQTSPQKE